jgi:hypothetical protein
MKQRRLNHNQTNTQAPGGHCTVMEWNRSEILALAAHNCTRCHGVGSTVGKRGRVTICACVHRAVFRACYDRFRRCAEKEKALSKVTLDLPTGNRRRYSWGRKDEEYIADFCLVSRRYLDDMEYKIFKFHYLLGADWRLCTRQLKIEKGEFFHYVYRIQQRLGRIFRELKPYALYPLDEYFASTGRAEPEQLRSPEAERIVALYARKHGRPLVPPIREAA